MTEPSPSPKPGPAPVYWQPVIAYAVLVVSCLWAVVPSPTLDVAGHVLGEHWYSLYNLMLAAAATLVFLRARLRRDPGLAWRVLDLAVCGAIVTGIGKLGFPHLHRPSGGPSGFPSGHALTAFAAAWLLMETFPNVSPYAFLIAVAVGWSRVEIHEHYTYQVLIGAALGMMVGFGITRAPHGVGISSPACSVRRRRPSCAISPRNVGLRRRKQSPEWYNGAITAPATGAALLTAPATALSARELTTDADHAAWNAFVGSRPEGDVLQAWEWADVKRPDWTPLRLAVFREGRIVGGAALLRRALPVVGNYLYGSRGPLLEDWADEAVFNALLDAIKAAAGNAAFLRLDPAVPVERADVTALLTRHGFAPAGTTDAQGFGGMQPRCVMQLDLAGRSETEILASFKGQTRRNIKLGLEKHGVEIVTDTTRDDLTAFHALYAETAARDGFRPYSLAYFRQLWDSLVPAGMAKLFLTRYEGQWLSGAICFLIGDKCWYVFGASSNEHRNVMPNYAMQWAMIRWAKSQDCAWYDFRGVSPRRRQEGESAAEVEKEDHLQGLNRFKEGFGTRYVEYIGEYDLVYNPLAYWAFTTGKPTAQKLVGS